MNQLQGKTALITGGGSGIGLAVARLFLRQGARVAITGRDADKLSRAAAELNAGERLITHAADLSVPEQARQAIEAVTARLGHIDVLVNNAGINIKERGIRELTPESWQLVMRANLDSAFYCIHAVLPQMVQRHDGIIINVSSVAGKRAGPLGGAAYVASKFGMTGLGICLAAEEKDSGVRVSNVYPGEVNTPILEARPQPLTDEQRRKILQPEDIALAVLFVAALPPHVSVPELVIKPTGQVYI
jgi:NAD(P)-dependent dehydrogenase (short-subunit alcohol dehydrogenase family)